MKSQYKFKATGTNCEGGKVRSDPTSLIANCLRGIVGDRGDPSTEYKPGVLKDRRKEKPRLALGLPGNDNQNTFSLNGVHKWR